MQWTSKLKTSHTWGKYHVENPIKCIEEETVGILNKRLHNQMIKTQKNDKSAETKN